MLPASLSKVGMPLGEGAQSSNHSSASSDLSRTLGGRGVTPDNTQEDIGLCCMYGVSGARVRVCGLHDKAAYPFHGTLPR